jgi:hypothetical protein
MSDLHAEIPEAEPLIETANPDFENYKVHLRWRNGAESFADFSHLVGKGVFESFSDRNFFNSVKLEHEGRALAWPRGIDFDSLLLWYTANPQTVPASLSKHLPSKSPFAPKSVMVSPRPGG